MQRTELITDIFWLRFLGFLAPLYFASCLWPMYLHVGNKAGFSQTKFEYPLYTWFRSARCHIQEHISLSNFLRYPKCTKDSGPHFLENQPNPEKRNIGWCYFISRFPEPWVQVVSGRISYGFFLVLLVGPGVWIPITRSPVLLRLGVLALLCTAKEFLATYALKCASWTAVNQGTSGRAPCASLGIFGLPSVDASNTMTARILDAIYSIVINLNSPYIYNLELVPRSPFT